MIIYITTNLINGKKYIGRDAWNKPNYFGGGKAIKDAIKKYGKENFKKEIIEVCKDKNHLLEREEYWLNYYDAAKNKEFYNMINSNKGWEKGKPRPERKGKRLSDDVRKLISENGKGKKKKSGPRTPIIQYEYKIIKTPIKEYESITEASKSTGILGCDIGAVCKGKQITAGGYIWGYKKEKS